MPTPSLPSALLTLTFQTNHALWTWPQWQDRTGLDASPLSTETETYPEDWTPAELEAVHAYSSKFWALSDEQRIIFARNKPDQDASGRKAWGEFVRSGWNKDWKAYDGVVDVLKENKADPFSAMRRLKTLTRYFEPARFCSHH
jgi:hypothetical protein